MADVLEITKSSEHAPDQLSEAVRTAFDMALAGKSKVSDFTRGVPGMSGQRYRSFINNLIGLIPSPRYIEVGSLAGSTACAAMDGNALTILCIDNWALFGGPKDMFVSNTNHLITDAIKLRLIEEDFRKVDTGSIGKFNVYLFDGPHEREDQYEGLHLYQPALDDEFIFIVDDWNWDGVRDGTFGAIKDNRFNIDYAITVRTTLNGQHSEVTGHESDWHNGYFISKLSKPK